MKQTPRGLLENYRANVDFSLAFINLLIALMMVCVAVGFVQVGRRFFPGWHGGYLVWVALLVSLEAIYTRKQTRTLDGRERWLFHISEWIAFAVVIKILLYLINNPAQLLADLPLWQEDFFTYFFTAEYLIALVIIGMIWLITKLYSREFDALHDSEQDGLWDELGKVQNTINATRQRIASRVFLVGGLVVILAVAARIESTALFRLLGTEPPGYRAPVANVVAYFVFGFIMLSQTQFTLLRTRWIWQRLAISPDIARNWIRYGLLSSVVLAIIVFFLPTEYSIGLFDSIRYVIEFVVQALTFLLFLVTLPFTACLSLLRLGEGKQNVPAQAPPLLPPLVDQPAGEPTAWLEVVRSIAFWVVFIAVIVYALRFFLSQNTALWEAISNFPLFRFLSRTWQAVWNWMKGANKQVGVLVRSGIQRLRRARPAITINPIQRIFNLSRMNAREKVIYYYLNFVQLSGERGLDRRASQTPYAYEKKLANEIPDIDPDLHGLTDTFIEARYSQHPVDEPAAEKAASLWDHLRAVLRSWKRNQE